MLKWVIWLLVLANAGYFAWSQGYLASMGYAPPQVREPQRLDAQIKPEAQRLLNAPRDIAPESPAITTPAAQREIEPAAPALPPETEPRPPAPAAAARPRARPRR